MTTEELAAAGLPAEPEIQDKRLLKPQKTTTLLLLVDPGLAKMWNLDQKRRKSEMSMLMSKILLQQSNRDLFLRP
jgi:hypothetical protein